MTVLSKAFMLEVLALVDKEGAVTLNQVCHMTGCTKEEARHALAYLSLKDKLVWFGGKPPQGVFFGRPAKGAQWGLRLRRGMGATRPIGHIYTERWKIIRKIIGEPPEGVTRKDIIEAMELSEPVAVNTLTFLVSHGELLVRPANTTGYMGKPPNIYGPTEESIARRETRFIAERKTNARKGSQRYQREKVKERNLEQYREDARLLREAEEQRKKEAAIRFFEVMGRDPTPTERDDL